MTLPDRHFPVPGPGDFPLKPMPKIVKKTGDIRPRFTASYHPNFVHL